MVLFHIFTTTPLRVVNTPKFMVFYPTYMDDKRKFRRFQISLNSLLTRENHDSLPLTVTAIDASYGGIGLICTEELAIDTLITLTWERPPFAPGQTVSIRGRVVSSRRKPTQAGKFAVSIVYADPDTSLAQKLVHWAQMQSLVKAKTQSRIIGQTKLRGSSFY